MRLTKKTLITLMVGLFLSMQLSATSVTLKDGRIFEGQIKSQNAEKIVMDMRGLEVTLPKNQVSTIYFSEETTNVESTPLSTVQPTVASVLDPVHKIALAQQQG